MRIRRTLAVLGLLPALTVGGVVTPTAAAQESRWGAPVRVATGAFPSSLVATPDGHLYGVAAEWVGLRLPLSLVHRTPRGTWSSTRLPYSGRPVAVADDGRTTFFLYTPDGCRCELHIAEVPHGGTPSPSRLLDRAVDDLAGGTLIARDGKWWAAWVAGQRRTPAPPRGPADFVYTLREARTVLPEHGTRPLLRGVAPDDTGLVPVRELNPQLVWRGARQALLTLDRPGSTEFWAANLPRGFQPTPHRLLTHNASQPQGARTAVTTVGARTYVALWRGGRLALAQDDGDLRFTERILPSRALPGGLLLTAARGRVFVGHSACFSSLDGFTCRGYVAVGDESVGAFRSTDLSAPFALRYSDIRAGLAGLVTVRGRATALLSDGSGGLWSRSER